jgi:hypothetical protein
MSIENSLAAHQRRSFAFGLAKIAGWLPIADRRIKTSNKKANRFPVGF